MWHRSRVVVVIPAWDEANHITGVLGGIPPWVDAIVVVDDASADGTAEIARSVGDPRVEVVRHETNRGVGAAIASGYAWALARGGGALDVFVVMAGDAQMDPEDLPGLIDPIARGDADYVKGHRFGARGIAQTMPAGRLLVGLALSWATSRAVGLPLSDSQCGYTALSRSACEKVDLGSLWPGYGYPNDLLSQIALRGLRVIEVPVRPVYANEVSRLKPRHVPVIAALVARAWLRRWLAGTAGSQTAAEPSARSRIAGI